VSSLPKAVTWKQTGRDSNQRPFASRANALPLLNSGHLWCLCLHGDVSLQTNKIIPDSEIILLVCRETSPCGKNLQFDDSIYLS